MVAHYRVFLQPVLSNIFDLLLLSSFIFSGFGGSIDVASLIEFVDSGHDLILSADGSACEFIREIDVECGVDFDEVEFYLSIVVSCCRHNLQWRESSLQMAILPFTVLLARILHRRRKTRRLLKQAVMELGGGRNPANDAFTIRRVSWPILEALAALASPVPSTMRTDVICDFSRSSHLPMNKSAKDRWILTASIDRVYTSSRQIFVGEHGKMTYGEAADDLRQEAADLPVSWIRKWHLLRTTHMC